MGMRSDSQDLRPVSRNTLLLSVVVPAHNEENNIAPTLRSIASELGDEGIPFEIVVVNDNSSDATPAVVAGLQGEWPQVRLVSNDPPAGLGRAVRCGLRHVQGDVVGIMMADSSDQSADLVRCYRKIEEGYDCAFGSRFMPGGRVTHYPPVKFVANRIANKIIQVLFWTRHNDLTNAFKVYRRHVIESIQPLHAAHFNITIEMSLSALIRRYRIAMIPIHWSGRTWGQSHLRLRQMGRRYLCTLLELWFERVLIGDDLLAEKRLERLPDPVEPIHPSENA